MDEQLGSRYEQTMNDRNPDVGKRLKHVSKKYRKKSEESSQKSATRRENESRKKKKREIVENWATTMNNEFLKYGEIDLDLDGGEIRQKGKKRQLELEAEQTSSNAVESYENQHKKLRVDPSVLANSNVKSKKEKKQKSSSHISENITLQNNKHKSKTRKHRHRERCFQLDRDEDISCNQGTKHIHSCLESSTLESAANVNSSSDISSQSRTRKEKRLKKKKKKKEKEKGKHKTVNTATVSKAVTRHANIIHETWTLSKDRLSQLQEKGIKVKKGKWSLQELNLLQSNMAKFLENHGLENPYAILFHSRMDKEECRYWKRFAHTTNFYQLLGEGIPRALDSIYKCALRIYDSSNYIGKYSGEEVKELERLHGVHGTDWVTIGQLMGRSRMSVNRKFSTLPATKGSTKSGKWTDDEISRLKEAVHLVTNTPEGKPVPFHGIHWPAVAQMVKTRNKERCRRKWLDRLCWTEDEKETLWTKDDELILITRLYNSGITEECDIDWMEVKSELKNNYSPQWLSAKWSKIKKKVPNYHQLDFEDVVDYLFHEYGRTLRNHLVTVSSEKTQ